MEYQQLYFEEIFIQKNIENLNWILINDKNFHIEGLNKNE